MLNKTYSLKPHCVSCWTTYIYITRWYTVPTMSRYYVSLRQQYVHSCAVNFRSNRNVIVRLQALIIIEKWYWLYKCARWRMSGAVRLLHYTPSWSVHGRIYLLHKIWTFQAKFVLTDDRIWPEIWNFFRRQIKIVISVFVINLLATDFFQILAHPVFKMWVIQKSNKIASWNKRNFEEKKLVLTQHV